MKSTHFAALAALLAAASSHAATVSVLGGTAPAVDGADIANVNTTTTGGDILNGDRGYTGLTFTTGSNATGYTLSALSFYQIRSTTTTGGRFKLRMGTLSGLDITTFYLDETADEANNFYTLSGTGGEWMQFVLTTSQTLAANTTYTIDLGRGDGGNYITWGMSGTDGSDYTGGYSYRTSGTYVAGPDNPIIASANQDKVFHLDMIANAIPEPGSLALMALGTALIARRRRA